MALQKQVTNVISPGPIYMNMNDKTNPLKHIKANKWISPSNNNLLKIDKFYDKFNKDSKCLLTKGGQSSIYTFIGKDKLLNNDVVIVKEYDIRKYEEALQDVYTEFVLVKQAKLLMYDELYYNEKKKSAIITIEPLNYTLREYVEIQNKDRMITEKECKSIIIDIMDKLWTIHKCGYIHNDLTPDNIMWRNGDMFCKQTNIANINGSNNLENNNNNNNNTISNGWKLIDFGLIMKINDFKNKRYRYKGTRGWTPPEINVDSLDNEYSIGKDIWSLGLIILYILFKKQPYTLTYYEQQDLCNGDREQYKTYFYYNKLLQMPFNKNRNKRKKSIESNNKVRLIMKKLMKVNNNNNDKENNNKRKKKNNGKALDYKDGEKFLKKYLKNLYDSNLITYDLCNLLTNYILTFDPKNRLNCAQIYRHKWFNDMHHL